MVKKLLPILLAMLLLTLTAMADVQIIDNANLFSSQDITSMQTIIDRIEREHSVDMVVLTTYDTPKDYSESMWKVRDYADDFYDRGGYGMGADNSGMLILLDMNNRVIWLSTGGVMIEYINDSREEAILDAAYPHLSWGDYGDAMVAALQKIERYMAKGREEGTFLYDETTGERLSGIYNALTSAEMGIAAIAGGVVALIVFMSVNGTYNLKGSTYSYDRGANTSVQLTQDDEVFVRQFINRTPRHTGSSNSSGGGRRSSGGSGVHRSSGGVRHGGGGRRF